MEMLRTKIPQVTTSPCWSTGGWLVEVAATRIPTALPGVGVVGALAMETPGIGPAQEISLLSYHQEITASTVQSGATTQGARARTKRTRRNSQETIHTISACLPGSQTLSRAGRRNRRKGRG